MASDTREARLQRIAVGMMGGGVNWPTLVFFAGCLAGIAASTIAALAGAWPIWAATLANGVLIYAIFTPMHEASHGILHGGNSAWRWLNPVVGRISGLVMILPYGPFKSLHMTHHRATNDPEHDPDHWVATRNPWMVLPRCLTLMVSYHRSLMRSGSTKDRIDFLLTYALVGVLAAVLIGAGYGWELLWLWIVPHFIGVGLLAFFFDYAVHYPHDSRERYRDTRIHLAGEGSGGPVSWLYLWQNFHLIHHLFPRIPFYRYGRAFKAMRGELEAENAPIKQWR